MRARPKRRSLAVAVPFPVWPPMGGGQVRLYELYRRLAEQVDVELVCLEPGGQSSSAEVAPGLRQTAVGASARHRAREAALREKLGGAPITDVVMPALISDTPDYARAFRRAAVRAAAQVASHPYAAPVLAPYAPYLPLVYEAQDVEVELKRDVLHGTLLARDALALVERVESWCARRAARVMVCSASDGERLSARYGTPPTAIALVPNGVDDERVPFTPPEQRAGSRECLFIGSNHPPNAAAARRIGDLARRMPDVRFTIAGGVRDAVRETAFPHNVDLLGPVPEPLKLDLLARAAVALNPIEYGSGTSLKLVEYCAAGLPVVTTPEGLRGLPELAPGCVVAEMDAFQNAVDLLLFRDPAERADVRAARRAVEQRYSWRVIAQLALEALRPLWS
ncbi:MAG TPA: glycosyltransferase family 4 protein [Myxococcales bacterium]|nr:glycosyltransferase family 4 protein [Myxococcales bacterium]